jgi:hypothetical protein
VEKELPLKLEDATGSEGSGMFWENGPFVYPIPEEKTISARFGRRGLHYAHRPATSAPHHRAGRHKHRRMHSSLIALWSSELKSLQSRY